MSRISWDHLRTSVRYFPALFAGTLLISPSQAHFLLPLILPTRWGIEKDSRQETMAEKRLHHWVQ